MEKEKKQRNNNGEMPEWMVNCVTTNNLVVGKDVKLDESKASQRKKRSSNATSGKGNGARVGTKTGSKGGAGSQTSRPKSRSSPGGPRNLESVLRARVGLVSEDHRACQVNNEEVYFRRTITIPN